MPDPVDPIAAVRHFNRFYTRAIGVLDEKLLASEFSLSEVRVLYEIAHRATATAAEIAKDLKLDAGYLSRILRGFDTRGLISRAACASDARQTLLSLTPAGRATIEPLEQRSQQNIAALLENLSAAQQHRLVEAMHTIEGLLGTMSGASPGSAGVSPGPSSEPYVIRPPRAGDIGWVIERHGALYAQEYGFEASFEALVAKIAANILSHFDPRRDACWIAERRRERIGSAFVVGDRNEAGSAKLRLLLVEPSARGLGIGRRLVEECIVFAQAHGYARLILWTNDILHAARRLYERAGFRLIRAEPHRSFGRDLIGETWQLELSPQAKVVN